MRRLTLLLMLMALAGMVVSTAAAQNPMVLSLESASLDVQTGQTYEVNIRLDGASEVWLADMQISYDPAKVYILGTKSGSPVEPGTLFDPAASLPVQNAVNQNRVLFTLSMLAPVEPVSGSGIIGTFRIYPLAAGTTQLLFSQAELDKAIFETRDGQRVGTGVEKLNFTPVLLELNITGDTVEPPSEATATPAPTDTPLPPPTSMVATEVPTLVNATAAPRTPEPLTLQDVPAASGESEASIPVLLGVVLIVIAVIGFGVLLMQRRTR